MSTDEIMTVINAEILWCEQNPDKAFHAEYRKGFVNGLIQAKYLIGEMARVERRHLAQDTAHALTQTGQP